MTNSPPKSARSRSPAPPPYPVLPRGSRSPRGSSGSRIRPASGSTSSCTRGTASRGCYRFCKLLLLLVIVKNLFGYVQTYFTEYLEQKVLYRIRRDVFAHIQNLPLSFFDREKTGHIISRLTNDVNLLRGAIIGVVASIIRNTMMTFIAIMIILLVSWKLTLVSLVVIPLNVALVGMIGLKLKKRSHRAQEGMADMTANLEESITGVRVVKAFNQGDFEKDRFDRYNLRPSPPVHQDADVGSPLVAHVRTARHLVDGRYSLVRREPGV